MFQFKYQDRRQDKPYLYRLSLECMGRELVMGISLKDLTSLVETGKMIARQPKQFGVHVRSLKEKWKNNGGAPAIAKVKKGNRKEEAVAAEA